MIRYHGDTYYNLITMIEYSKLVSESSVINQHTQDECIRENCRIGYTWTGGNPKNNSHAVSLELRYGTCFLGGGELQLISLPSDFQNVKDTRICSELHVEKKTRLTIASEYEGYKYDKSSITMKSSETGSTCRFIISGEVELLDRASNIILNGDSCITIEEGALLDLLDNSSIIKNDDNSSVNLIINGTMKIDSIDQITTLKKNNIEFGPKGMLVIRNHYIGDDVVVLSIPNGIKTSMLYELFWDRLEHIEFHMQSNCGIEIDEYYEYYGKDLKDWYGGIRLEDAVSKGLIKWHDNAFILLNGNIIPWANNMDFSLLDFQKLFYTEGNDDVDKIQYLCNVFINSGFGNVRCIAKHTFMDESIEYTMQLRQSRLKNSYYNPLKKSFQVEVENGECAVAFVSSNNQITDIESIIDKKSKMIKVENNRFDIPLQ